MADGLTVGTYTSPNLARVNERLTRNGEPIDDDELAEVLGALAALEPMLGERSTRFEILTAAAFRWFADSPVDVAVVEVGLGGTWDATNVVDPDVAVVTNVSYDHVEILGPTLRRHRHREGGHHQAGVPARGGGDGPRAARGLPGPRRGVRGGRDLGAGRGVRLPVEPGGGGGRLLDLRTPGAQYPEVYLSLHGAHQGDNAACALAAAEAFFGAPLAPEVVEHALGAVRVPGRFEIVGRTPVVVLDGAHNVAGAHALAEALRSRARPRRRHGGGDRDAPGSRSERHARGACARPGVATVVACTAPSPRALPAAIDRRGGAGPGLCTPLAADTVADALDLARARLSPTGTLVVTGSLYVVAEARALLLGSTQFADPGSLSEP